MSTQTFTPEVLWAQRSDATDAAKNYIYLTISVPDCSPEDLKLDLKPAGLTFDGKSSSQKKAYHVELEFYAEIDPDQSKVHHTSKNIEIVLRKKELKEEYWPRLLKGTQKMHFLKTDFDKWVDEDEQDEAPEDELAAMGGMPGAGGMGGMPGAGGMGGMDMASLLGGAGGGMGDFDFSKLGDMGGLGAGGFGGDDGSDDGLPEGDDAEAEEASGDAKIEEVK